MKIVELTKFATEKLKFAALQKWIIFLSEYQTPVTLLDAATVNWDVSRYYNSIVTLTTSRTLNISGAVPGTYGTIEIVQGGSGSYTLTLPSNSKVANSGAGVIALSTAVGARDIATFYYNGTSFNWTFSTSFT